MPSRMESEISHGRGGKHYNYLYDISLIYGILIKAAKIKLFMLIETEKRK